MATYNKIIAGFKSFSEKHKQVNTFFSGEEWDFQVKTNIYPAVLVAPDNSTIEQGRFFLKFNVFVVDLLNSDNSNTDEIYSDMLQICGDFIAEFQDNEDDYGFTIEEGTSIIPLHEEMDDKVGGWVMQINVQLLFNSSECGLPIN